MSQMETMMAELEDKVRRMESNRQAELVSRMSVLTDKIDSIENQLQILGRDYWRNSQPAIEDLRERMRVVESQLCKINEAIGEYMMLEEKKA